MRNFLNVARGKVLLRKRVCRGRLRKPPPLISSCFSSFCWPFSRESGVECEGEINCDRPRKARPWCNIVECSCYEERSVAGASE